MQTLAERVEKFCSENGKEIPYGKHLNAISREVIAAVKLAGKEDGVKKKNVAMLVNNYPNNVLPIVDKVIADFFNNKSSFMTRAGINKSTRIRYFNFDVEDYKAEAFEAALRYLKIEVLQNHVQKGKAQYKIPVGDPATLIKLGKRFQTERWMQENRIKLDKYIKRKEQKNDMARNIRADDSKDHS